MELQISYRVCAKVSKEDILWRDASRDREDIARIMWMERSKYYRSRSMSRSYSHARRNTTQDECVKFHGISQREEQFNQHERHANLKYKHGNRSFWCRGYFVDTAGKNTKKIKEYIQKQLEEDKLEDQLTFREYEDPFKGSKQ